MTLTNGMKFKSTKTSNTLTIIEVGSNKIRTSSTDESITDHTIERFLKAIESGYYTEVKEEKRELYTTYNSHKEYKDIYTKETLQELEKFYQENYQDVHEAIKQAGGIKKWRKENNITAGLLVTFGSHKYYTPYKIECNVEFKHLWD